MKHKKIIAVILSVFLISLILGLFHRQIFKIRKVEIVGLSWLKAETLEPWISAEESLISLDREALMKKIMATGYAEEVLITRQLLDRLIIEVKEKSVVARIFFQEKSYYLTAKNEILTEKSYLLPKKVPEIFLQNRIESSRLIWLAGHLEKMKFHDENFFSKIHQISFEESEDSYNFIMDSKRIYILSENFKLEDLLRVRYLEGQISDYRVFDLRGSYIIVRG